MLSEENLSIIEEEVLLNNTTTDNDNENAIPQNPIPSQPASTTHFIPTESEFLQRRKQQRKYPGHPTISH